MDRHKPFTSLINHLLTVLCTLLATGDCFARQLLDDSDVNDRSEPHPWLATAPGEYLRLINRGNVEIQVNDSILASYGKAALTRFKIKLDYKCIYRPPRASVRKGEQIFVLDVRYTKRDLSVNHTVIIPTTYSPEEPWSDRLMKHEMDHVAITTDPRLQDMVRGLFSRGFAIEVQPNANRDLRPDDYQSEIDQYTQESIREIESLLQYQYDMLDRSSNDGLVELQDRADFFLSLYDYDACKKHLPKSLGSVSKDLWNKWTKIDSKKLAAHYSLSR
ncbi:MAG: hypothetical protein MUC83_03940 [Pirellula sp.]|nr:hypothetical protein [Pirellula sp.]